MSRVDLECDYRGKNRLNLKAKELNTAAVAKDLNSKPRL